MFMTFMMALKLTKCCYEQSSVASKAHHMKQKKLHKNKFKGVLDLILTYMKREKL